MKGIKIIIIGILFALMGCEDNPRPAYNDTELGQFVRFALVLESNGDIITDEHKTTRSYVSRYEHGQFAGIKIPVALTTASLQTDVEVSFTTDAYGDFDGFGINPENKLHFSPDKFVDTISIDFTNRWDTLVQDSIVLTLTETSHPAIGIGYPFGTDKNNQLSIVLNEIVLPYTLGNATSFDLSGKANESFNFDVLFTNGLIASDLDTVELLVPQTADFDYTLTQHPYKTGDTRVRYTFTVNETLDNELKYYACAFNLADVDGYSKFGNTSIIFQKHPTNVANNSLNTARHFYDVTYDAYNRLYTLFSIVWNNNVEPSWRRSSQHCVPVPVSADHPNAVLHEDGNYYHAFQLGFNTPNPGRTTNSFGLKYWFDNEYTDADKSPGFNVTKALEFYPKDGTSATEGTVSVIKQDIVISSKNDQEYTFSIAGEGTYYYEEGSNELHKDSIFWIEILFELTNDELFGGTKTTHYKFLNRSPEKSEYPDTMYDDFIVPIEL